MEEEIVIQSETETLKPKNPFYKNKKIMIPSCIGLVIIITLAIVLPIVLSNKVSYYNGSSYSGSTPNIGTNIGISSKFNFQTNYGHLSYNSWCNIGSDGSWMEIDTNPNNIEDYYSATALNKIKDVNKDLGFTDALYQKMITTRAIDGRQKDESSKAKVSWTYHPDKGLEVLYEQK